MNALASDLRHAVRRVARTPGFLAVATLLIAVGIGSNIALFALSDALFFTPRPGVHDAGRLVWVTQRSAGRRRMAYPDLQRYGSETRVFDGLAGFSDDYFAIGGDGEPERVRGQVVTGDYFTVLRAPMALGRTLGPADDRANAPIAVVISHGLWTRRFGADSAVVGRVLELNGRRATIVGVATPGFNGADLELPREVWVPVVSWTSRMDPTGARLRSRDMSWLEAIGRLRAGVRRADADAALATVAHRIAAADTGAPRTTRVHTESAATGIPAGARQNLAPLGALCVGVTVTVLLIACANLSNLLLARGIARQREIGVRMAIGASRARVIRHLLIESAMLAAIGAAVGVLLAMWGIDAFFAGGLLPIDLDVRLNPRSVVVTIAVATATTLLFGLIPAIDATRRDVSSALKDGAQGLDRRRSKLQGRLVIAQVVLSVVLLVGATLFVQTLRRQQSFDLGFDASDRVLSVALNLNELGYPKERNAAFLRQLRERAAALPGVEQATYADNLPMGEVAMFADVTLDQPVAGTDPRTRQSIQTLDNRVDPGYFDLMRIPVHSGREFTTDDRAGAEPVTIISDAMAKKAWPGQNPIGRRLRLNGDTSRFLTVVGIAADAYVLGAEQTPRPMIYLPRAQNATILGTHLVIRAARSASDLAPELRAAMRSLDRTVPVGKIQTMAQYRIDNLEKPRNASLLMTIFGAIALGLASIGLYAVIAFSVEQRQREIGIRLALGAAQRNVVRLFVRHGLRLVSTGLAVGGVLAIGVARFLASAFFGVTLLDLAAALGTVATLLLVALVAAWLPARRAAGVDLATALRAE